VTDYRPELDKIVGDDVTPAERERLRRAHELMLAAGPLPELPPSLQYPPVVDDKHESSAAFALLPRRGGRILTLAAGFAAMTLVIGYIIGNHRNGFDTSYSVAMKATPAAPKAGGVVRVGHTDDVGNWPLELEVVGLRELPKDAYYTLYLTRHRKPAASCGSFRVHEGQTVVRLNVPYNFRRYDGWIVAANRPPSERPGPVLLEKYFT
jgi:hypothetical protein